MITGTLQPGKYNSTISLLYPIQSLFSLWVSCSLLNIIIDLKENPLLQRHFLFHSYEIVIFLSYLDTPLNPDILCFCQIRLTNISSVTACHIPLHMI